MSNMYFNPFYGHDIIAFAVEKGVTEEQFVVEKGVILKQGEAGHLSYAFVANLLEKAALLSTDPHFGLHLGEYFDLKATEAVDTIMNHASTIGEAFQYAAHFSRLISDAMDCWLEESGDRCAVIFEWKADWALQSAPAIRHNLETALVCACRSLQRLSKQSHYPILVQLPYPRPRLINEYYRIFNCRLEYQSKVAAITFQRKVLGQQIDNGESDLLNTLLNNAKKTLRELPPAPPFTTAVKKLILQQIQADCFPKIEPIASALGMGHRSLQRKLKLEGTLFAQLAADIKMELASKHLLENRHSIEEVAYLLGYSEASSFVRAFKRWKGISPGKYLNQFRK